MRGAMLFVVGLFTGLAVHVAIAQNANRGVVMMNHVGINVPNVEEAVKDYTDKMGYREAFRVNDDKGQVRLVYMQISKNTFLELNPANAQRPAGFTHYGLHVDSAADAVAMLEKRGVTVSDTNTSDTKAVLANITDPYMGRIELAGAFAGVDALQGDSELEMRAAIRASAVAVCLALFTIGVATQQRGGTAQTDRVQPVNSGANPYRVIRDWARLEAEGRPWGGSNGVAIDRDGRSVWATDRCSPGTTPGCLGTKANPVHHFDESGKEIRSFGAGMFAWPHSVHVDQDGNVWVPVDARRTTPEELKKFPGEKVKGNIVVKFSPEGKVLLTLGKSGVASAILPTPSPTPNDVVTVLRMATSTSRRNHAPP